MPTTLCHIDDVLNDSAKGFSVAEQALFVVKKHQRIFVYENRCPHRGIQLEWQPDVFLDVDKELIQCSSHGALFTIENGRCVSGPCLGDSLTAIPFTIDEGYICID